MTTSPEPLSPADILTRLESLLDYSEPQALHAALRQLIGILHQDLAAAGQERRKANALKAPEGPVADGDATPQRRAEDALRDNQARLDWVLRTTGVGLWFNALPLDRLNWDEQTRRLFFIPPTVEPTIALFWSRLHPQDRERTRAGIEAALRDGQLYEIDHRAVDPESGAIRWIRSAGQVAYATDGRPARFDGINYDITERKQAEAALHRNEARLRLLSETTARLLATDAPHALIHDLCAAVMTHLDCQVFVNYLVEEATGALQLSAYAGITALEAERMAGLEDDTSICQTVARTGHRIIAEDLQHHQMIESLGVRACCCLPLLVGQRVLGILCFGTRTRDHFAADEIEVMQSIANKVAIALERFQVQSALRVSEERYRGLVEQAADGIFVSDQRGRYLDVNTMGASMLGYSRDELLTLTIADVIAPEEVPRIAGEVAKLTNTQVLFSEWRFRRKDGSVFPGEVLARQLPDGRLQGILRDISERKCNEALLAEQAEQLRAAARLKDEFLAMLAHELRNPLAPIVNAVQILKSSELTDLQFGWCRDLIDRQAGHLKTLVDDLLDISRIARGTFEIARGRVEVADIVQRAVEATRPLIDGRRHRLSIQLPPEPIQVTGDLVRLTQVVANLLTNAAKYTDSGGQIRLRAEREGAAVTIRVQDTGRGIGPTVLPHLFDLFYQADRTLDRAEGGLGIGLSLVKRVVEMHGGTVQAFSDGPGQGSEFVVRLPPRADTGHSALTVARATDAAGQAPVRLLVVDDNRDAADSLAMLLDGEGCAVTLAYDGETALALALAQQPQLVLLDIGLPGMDGYAVAQAIRHRSAGAPIRLVALTGYGQPTDRKRSQAAGFDAHLVKPVDLQTLRGLLAEVRNDLDHPRPPADAVESPIMGAAAPREQPLRPPPPTRLAQFAGRHTAGALVTVLPHELSQPLAAIAMYSNATIALIRSGKSAPQELVDVLARIETQVKRAAEILARLREFVRPGEAAQTCTDLCQTISDAVALIRPFAASKQVKLVVDLPAEPVSLEASKTLIGQVVLNLLFNGIEAIEQAGSTQRQVRVSVYPEPTQVRVSVQDSGPGIRPEDTERIFTPFESDKPDACGLGLAISRSLIEALGGRLWADTTMTDGATLHVRLPRPAHNQTDQ